MNFPHIRAAEYRPELHRVTYGMYGTFEERIPTTDLRERTFRKIAYRLEPLVGPKMPRRPVVIVGAGRSGTSILSRVLEHPDVASYPGEALDLWFPGNFPWASSRLDKPPFWADPSEFTRLSLAEWTERDTRRIRTIFRLFQKMFAAPVFLNKNAMSSCSLRHINMVLPDAKFIHIVRDGRAVAVSHAEQQFARIQANPAPFAKAGFNLPFGEILCRTTLGWLAETAQAEADIRALHLREQGRIAEVRYEDFCAAPHETAARLADFIGIDPKKLNRKVLDSVKPTNDRVPEVIGAAAFEEMTEVMQERLAEIGMQI